ncbi:hypothetical protein KTD26_07375 [Burkholderia multivorans]|uniref:hypothetical protein n=1 Tax=Burkholderia multivorans TaxID=87883 RepID=UPI001C21AB93|nr:hypothetical protein [Burkholderia multivorans]MBU9142341.1 hypothetical protein [Burkholderia multivorans]
MRALAKRLRDTQADCADSTEAADAIDLLLAEVEAANMQLTVPDWAEGDDQAWDKVTPAVAWHLIERHGENWAHIGRMMQAYLDAHTATLRVELEAAAADKRDAERYRWMAEHFLGADFEWGRGEDGYGGIPALVIEIPETAKVWGCLDLTIDDQLSRAPASDET